MSNADKQLDECGCCEGVKRLTPASIENLPGLTALAYRVGTHGSFKSTMQAALSGQAPLRELTTRDDDDPAIALLDGWATVLDVLSFYQERIAGEGYLRTATERRSILEMARSIGYELRPGVAAGTFLAFTLETAPGAPRSARIPLGSKAQSTPAQDETPQVFETTEEILAVGAWNELRPKQTEMVPPSLGLKTIYLKGASTNLKPGDGLLIIGDERLKDPGNENWDFRRVTSITPVARLDAESSYTIVDLNEGLGSVAKHVNPAKVNPRVYALRQRCSLFGYNAPDWRAMPNSLKAGYLGLDPNNPTALFEALKQFTEWPDFNIAAISDPPPRASNGTGLYGEYYDAVDFKQRKLTRTDPTVNFDWGGGSPDPLIGSDTFSIRWTGWVQAKISDSYTFRVISDDGVRLWVDGKLIINEWHTQGATGHSSTSTVRMEAGDKHDIKLEYFEQGGAASVKLFWSAPGAPEQIIPISQLYPRDIHDVHLDAIYAQIPAGSWVVLGIPEYEEVYRVKEVAEDSRSNFTLSAKTTHLVLQGEQLRELFNERVRDTVVFGQSEELQWAERPITAPVAGIETELSKKAEGLVAGRLVAISGADASTGEHVAEIATIDRIAQANGSTKLLFTTNLEHSYRRDSMVINANVARATHGDTKEEVLGSGDGSRAFQKFVLKQDPLTFVSAAIAGGAQTTLAIRVEDVLWKEAPSLYRLASTERAYTTRIADDGKVTVQFGDGVTGARPPTGAENISAKYRVGIGLGGMLEAGQINLLMSRPLGVNGVANPLAPTGAEDPEERDQARQNAPITVLTLDRIVSLQDFEDFSRAFAGIGKAQATWLWAGEKRLIHLTVAGVDGGNVPPASELYRNLVTAIDGARHVDQRVKIESYKPVLFDVEAKLLIDPDYLFDDVRAAVEKALVDAFAFSSRSFGQAVTASEVIAIAQGVKGVVALDLDNLYFDGAAATLQPRLPANIAHWVVNEIKSAELLTVNRAGIKLTEMSQ